MRDEDINIIIGKNIRIRRSLKGYSQEVVAKHLGITFQQVQKYEKGNNAVLPARLVRLSQLFDCGVEDFFRDPAHDKKALASIPSNKSLFLVKSFERLDAPEVQKRISDLVHALAKPDREDS